MLIAGLFGIFVVQSGEIEQQRVPGMGKLRRKFAVVDNGIDSHGRKFDGIFTGLHFFDVQAHAAVIKYQISASVHCTYISAAGNHVLVIIIWLKFFPGYFYGAGGMREK